MHSEVGSTSKGAGSGCISPTRPWDKLSGCLPQQESSRLPQYHLTFPKKRMQTQRAIIAFSASRCKPGTFHKHLSAVASDPLMYECLTPVQLTDSNSEQAVLVEAVLEVAGGCKPSLRCKVGN